MAEAPDFLKTLYTNIEEAEAAALGERREERRKADEADVAAGKERVQSEFRDKIDQMVGIGVLSIQERNGILNARGIPVTPIDTPAASAKVRKASVRVRASTTTPRAPSCGSDLRVPSCGSSMRGPSC